MIIELTFRFKDKDKVYYTKFWSLDKSMIYDKNGYFWDENGLSAILDHDIGENLCNDNFPKYIDNYSPELSDEQIDKLGDEPYRIKLFSNPECKGEFHIWHKLIRDINFYDALYKVTIV